MKFFGNLGAHIKPDTCAFFFGGNIGFKNISDNIFRDTPCLIWYFNNIMCFWLAESDNDAFVSAWVFNIGIFGIIQNI